MDHRQFALEQWLTDHCQLALTTVEPLAGDASFRRYFRVRHALGTNIAMDAPLEHENCAPFIAISRALRAKQLHAPQVLYNDLAQGFLLLEDFGDRVYLHELNETNAEVLYTNALQALSILQATHSVSDWRVPPFTADFMQKELQIFKEWFLLRHLNLTLSHATEKMLADFFLFLTSSATSQPQVFMHRDYHSANLMLLPDAQVGILDFQDAFIGPVTYDLVSLLRDCYIAWPPALVQKLVLRYKHFIPAVAPVSDDTFLRWFDIMGLQRHLKALLTFARKYHRDSNANYLQHMPRTLQYIAMASAKYSECTAFHIFLQTEVLPVFEKVNQCAE